MPRRDGAGSSTRSGSIRNKYGHGAKLPLSPECPSFRAAEQIIRRLKSGRRERNFWMQRTGGQKSTQETANVWGDRKTGTTPANTPAETAYLESVWKPVVRSDWMVGAPGLEPGTR